MHMVYLGHVKSDIEMLLKWLNRNEVLTTFGKQANIYLSAVQNLRVNKYFTAHPFSTSSWGTGVWVSENYLLWGRVMKFFLLLPALHKERLEVYKLQEGISNDTEVCFNYASLPLPSYVNEKDCS